MNRDVTIKIFINMRTKEILLLNMVFGKIESLTAWFAQGSFLRYKEEEFKIKGWDVISWIVENQPNFDPNDKSELELMNSGQTRKFYKEHKDVSLNFDSSGEIYLTPFGKVNLYGGGVGKGKIILIPPITNESFWEKLMEAFEKSD